MESYIQKAKILVEALPYIQKYYGKIFVIKYGGSAMKNEELKNSIITDIILLKFVGVKPVIVHGGGPEITEVLNKLGKTSKFINGLRVTDSETMQVVEAVLTGNINKSIVSSIIKGGGKAIGFNGKDGFLIEAEKQEMIDENENKLDLGHVGRVVKINPDIINAVLEKDYIPVIAPIGMDKNGASYNINADYVAGEIAASLNAEKLVLITDVEGIYKETGGSKELLSIIKMEDIPNLIKENIITGGMIPKVESCVIALQKGVRRAHIINGNLEHSLLLEIFTDIGIGTMILKGEDAGNE